jgi:hypothetical protein
MPERIFFLLFRYMVSTQLHPAGATLPVVFFHQQSDPEKRKAENQEH